LWLEGRGSGGVPLAHNDGNETADPQTLARVRRGGRVHGRVIGCHVGRRVRLRWTPDTLDHETVFQVTLQEAPESLGRATILEIHQERLLGAAERQGLLDHWNLVLDDV
ncbi:hypothetical protein D1122_22355, partial [Cereibacter sphaeroides]